MTEPSKEAIAHQLRHRSLAGPCEECVPDGMRMCEYGCGRAIPWNQWCVCVAAISRQRQLEGERQAERWAFAHPNETVHIVSNGTDPATVGYFTMKDGKPSRIFATDDTEIMPSLGTALRVFNGTWECTEITTEPDGTVKDLGWTWHGDEEL